MAYTSAIEANSQDMVPSSVARFSFNLADALLILGAALTIWWQPITTRIPLKASDGLFLLALCAWGGLICREQRATVMPRPPQRFLLSLAVLLASLLVATLAGYLRYHLPMSRAGLILFGRLMVCMAVFLAVHMLSRRNTTFGKRISLALLSPVVLFPAMLIPSFGTAMWGADDHRFKGFTLNANTADQAFVTAFAFGFTLGIYDLTMKRRFSGLVFTIISAGMLMLIVWTQSRDYLVSTFACALLGAVLIASALKLSKWKMAILTAFVYAAIVTTILLLAPRSFVASLVARAFPNAGPQATVIQASETRPPAVARAPSTIAVLRGKIKTLAWLIRGTVRKLDVDPHIFAFRYYSRLLSTNFLGLGVNYETKFQVYVPSTGETEGASTILDVPTYGGVGAVLSLGYLLYLITQNVRRRIATPDHEKTPYVVGAATALGGLWIAAIPLGSPLFDYQFWILAALALGEPAQGAARLR